jgi:hypothetical protein
MAEQSIRSTAQNSGQASPVWGEIQVAHREHAAMDLMQTPGGNGTRDGTPRIAEGSDQLTNRDHAVLALRQLGKFMMRLR